MGIFARHDVEAFPMGPTFFIEHFDFGALWIPVGRNKEQRRAFIAFGRETDTQGLCVGGKMVFEKLIL
mgnify:CR=1 FL=1